MGRPEGSKITTEGLLLRETKEWMKVSQRTREMIEKVLDNFQTLIDGGVGGVDTSIQLLAGLQGIMTTATKVVESNSKLTSEENGPRKDDEDPDKILLELKEGK